MLSLGFIACMTMTSIKNFLYFAYGSNLLTQRIHISNPSAVRKAIGKVSDYRLDFNYYSRRWKGCAATIVPDKTSCVWGAVWELDISHMETLDSQEGVTNNVYEAISINVLTPEGEVLKCRSYQLCDQPPKLAENEVLPESRYPSKVYLDTIIKGAEESKLPVPYIKFLRTFPHNGYDAKIDFTMELNNTHD